MKPLLTILAVIILSVVAQAQQRTRVNQAPQAYSFASNTMHEVVISPSKIAVESYDHGKNRTDINIYAAYNRHLKDNIQIGGEGGIISATDSKGDSKGLFAVMGVFTFNLDNNLREAIFFQGGLGLYPSYDEDDNEFDSQFSFFGGVGKRFEVWGKLNYMPYARVWKRGDENSSFEIQALNFSIFY